jgi:hypothetical protein
MDIVYLALVLLFFGGAIAVAYGCEKLRRPS